MRNYSKIRSTNHKLLTKRKQIILVIIGIIFGCLYYFHHKKPPIIAKADVQATMDVNVEKVKSVNLPRQIDVLGKLYPAKQINISSEIAGKITKILFNDGQYVQKGQVIIQLDDSILKTKLASIKANVKFQENDYQRKLLLAKKGIISQQALEQTLTELKVQKAVLQESEALLSKTNIIAPFSGYLSEFETTEGDYINAGQKLVVLLDSNTLKVSYTISGKYFSDIKPNSLITFVTTAYPNIEFKAIINYISPAINSNDQMLLLSGIYDNTDKRLKPGLVVEIKQTIGADRQWVLAPEEAILAEFDGYKVFKVEKDKARLTKIQIGQHVEKGVQVISGLSPDDIVIVRGHENLKNNALINVKAPATV